MAAINNHLGDFDSYLGSDPQGGGRQGPASASHHCSLSPEQSQHGRSMWEATGHPAESSSLGIGQDWCPGLLTVIPEEQMAPTLPGIRAVLFWEDGTRNVGEELFSLWKQEKVSLHSHA
jgi:hypothetical protein